MEPFAGRQNRIHKEESGLFWGALSLIFLIRCGGLIFNNYTETVFLKRFGVEFLPILYIINPLVTLGLIGILAKVKEQVSAYGRLFGMMTICSLSVFLLWLLPAREGGLTYPLLFVMKVQFETLLSILFWNLCNELFNLSQSKRIFPLITAGGVLGDMGGNLASVAFSRWMPINQMMVVYSLILFMAAVVTRFVASRFPLQVVLGHSTASPKKKTGIVSQIRDMNRLAKKSALVWVIIGLSFFANVILPVMNYQFNVAIDRSIAGEDFMIFFFGTFRGMMSMVALILLFFSGHVYEKWSIPAALMFHPLNYVLVFLFFLFRLDLLSAVYARLSTNVIRTTFNQPVNNMIIGIFPDRYRAMIRPVLRGVVARGGLIIGSSMIFLCKDWVPTPYLSLIALPFVFCWIGMVIYMKRQYSKLIVSLLSSDTLDLKAIEERTLKKLFDEKDIREKLLKNFSRSMGADAVLHARILHHLGVDDLDDHILDVLDNQNPATMTRLIGFLSGTSRKRTYIKLKGLIDVNDRMLTRAMIQAAPLLDRKDCRDFFHTLKQKCRGRNSQDAVSFEIRTRIEACLLISAGRTQPLEIARRLNSRDSEKMVAGIIAAGQSGDPAHIDPLKRVLTSNTNDFILSAALRALHQLDCSDMDSIAAPLLSHADVGIRLAALDGLKLDSDDIQRKVLALLKDPVEAVRELAIKKIEACPHCHSQNLFEFLGKPSRRIREGIFRVLRALDIKTPELFVFFEREIDSAHACHTTATLLSQLADTPVNRLLRRHLREVQDDHIKTVLKVAALTDSSGRIRTIIKNLMAKDHRKRANALEALESTMSSWLLKRLKPYLIMMETNGPVIEKNCSFTMADTHSEANDALTGLLQSRNWVTARLARELIEERNQGIVETETSMEIRLGLQEKIILIQRIDLFKNLAVAELAAISEIARERYFQPGEVLFEENTDADTMYICIKGRVISSRHEVDVGRFEAGNSFGLSALLLDSKRLLTCTAETETRVLEIHKDEFEEMLMEYPHISLEIAKLCTRRIQRVLEKIKKGETQEALLKHFFVRDPLS